jgi:flotillin
MRNIVSQLTVEELNGNREEFMRRVKDEAAQSFQPIGMQLDVFNIQNISDNNGYLDALGQRRIAEVKRDAVIGRANAERDAAIQSAAAEQQGKIARAQADTKIAEANQERDLRLASIASEVDAAKARAGQAGPLAEAEAHRAVVLAGVKTDRERTEAQIGVEEQRARQQEKAVQADVVIPAEAERRAAVARAEGQRDADIAAATAAARRREMQGKADADARSILAGASQKEKEAEAAGNKALRLAEADGIRAVMTAEADGQAKRAEALNQLSDQAARQNVLPQLIQILPELADAIAKGVSIDRLVVVDGGAGGNEAAGGGAIQRAISVTPAVLNQVIEMAKGLGLDLSGLLGHVGIGTDGAVPAAVNGAAPAGRSS